MRQHILVVDADVYVLSTLQMRLRSMGHTVNTAETGWDALTKLALANYDVVLLDVMVSGFTGWTVLQHIQARYPLVPVVTMTWLSAQAAAETVPVGVRACLVKPLEPLALHKALQGCAGAATERSYQGLPMTARVMRPSREM